MEKVVLHYIVPGLLQPRRCLSFLVCLVILSFLPPVSALDSQDSSVSVTNKMTVELGLETFDAVWKIINETHFDPQFGGVNWEQVRNELRPKVEAAQSMETVRKVIMEMLSRLKESHMFLMQQEKSSTRQKVDKTKTENLSVSDKKRFLNTPSDFALKGAWQLMSLGVRKAEILPQNSKQNVFAQSRPVDGDVGLDVRLVGDKCIIVRVDPSGPAALAKIKAGWTLSRIDGTPLSEVFDWVTATESKERDRVSAWSMIQRALLGVPGSVTQLELITDKKRQLTVELTRRPIPGEPVKFGLIPTLYAQFQKEVLERGHKKIGVFHYNIWMLPLSKDIDAAVDEMRGMDGIVIDLRGNLGGVMGMLMGVSGHFFDDNAVLGTVKMRQTELRLAANPRLVNASGKRVTPFKGPLAILVDEISLSASEVFAGGMQDLGRARVFGQKTTGQALPAIFDRLPNGDTLMHAMGDFITSSGKRLEGKGVTPDQVVLIDPRSLAAGKDTVMETAVDWILTQQNKTIK